MKWIAVWKEPDGCRHSTHCDYHDAMHNMELAWQSGYAGRIIAPVQRDEAFVAHYYGIEDLNGQ